MTISVDMTRANRQSSIWYSCLNAAVQLHVLCSSVHVCTYILVCILILSLHLCVLSNAVNIIIMRLKPKPKIRPGGATRERSSVQQSVVENEKITSSSSVPVTIDSVILSKSCTDSQEVTSQTSNCESVESTISDLTSIDSVSSRHSNVTLQTCNASSTSTTVISSSTVNILTTSVTSSSDSVTSSSYKSSSTSCVTTTSTNVTSSTRPTSLSMTTSLTEANTDSTSDTPVSTYSNDVITDLFNDEELPNVVQAENVLICEDDNLNVDNNSENDDDDEESTTEHQYPSFVESLSQIMSSHKALGLEQPADGEVQSSAVEGTLRQRCDDSGDDDDEVRDGDPSGDGGDNVVEDISVEGTSEKQVLYFLV